MALITTRLLPPGNVPEPELTYVVMGALYRGKWIFVRHRQRTTWEMPAGHIEPGESAEEAAARELFEEAGVLRCSLEAISDYQVSVGPKTEYGRLYTALVETLDPQLEHETGEVLLADRLPASLTYPEVQTLLFERVKDHF